MLRRMSLARRSGTSDRLSRQSFWRFCVALASILMIMTYSGEPANSCALRAKMQRWKWIGGDFLSSRDRKSLATLVRPPGGGAAIGDHVMTAEGVRRSAFAGYNPEHGA